MMKTMMFCWAMALQRNVAAPPQLRLRVPLRFKAAPFIGCVNVRRIARFIQYLPRGIAASAAAHAWRTPLF